MLQHSRASDINTRFYEEFAGKYDRLVSFENRVKREAGFFKRVLTKNKVKSVLDCSCGTGHHVIMLNLLGYDAKGSDISAAMIRQAKENSKKRGLKPMFKISDFRSLTENFCEKFDAVICVGNSLPHLMSDAALTKALKEMHAVLRKGGLLVIEQRNYDKLTKSQKRFFPVSFRKADVFFYVLDYYPKKIVFNVVDLDTKNRTMHVYKSEYKPLKKDKLVKLLKKAGFGEMEFYQDYRFSLFDKRKSGNLILICKK